MTASYACLRQLTVTVGCALFITACGGGGGGAPNSSSGSGGGGASPALTIGGSVSGLANGAQLVLLNNGANATTISSNGSFSLVGSVTVNGNYAVTVGSQPIGQSCSVAGGSITNLTNSVSSIVVTCSSVSLSIAGSVTGLLDGQQLTLLVNGTDPQKISVNGSFGFQNKVAYGSPYSVTVGLQPTVQDCNVVNGSSPSITSPVTNIQVNCSLSSPLRQAATLLPDISSAYNTLCSDANYYKASLNNNFPQVQSAAVFNMVKRNNTRKDLAFTLWCSLPGGTVYFGETPSGAVFFQQADDGSFTNVTKERFGTDLVPLRGVAWEPIVYDFNGDGYDEIIWPVQGEDGRAQQPVYRQSLFLTSTDKGNYSIDFKGSLTNNAGANTLLVNENGGMDVVTIDMYWRYTNQWQERPGYEWYGLGTVFFRPRPPEVAGMSAVRPSGPSVSLLKRSTVNANWQQVDRYTIPSRPVPFITWRKEVTTTDLIRIDGKDYIYPLFEKGCELTPRNGSPSVYFSVFTASMLSKNYVEGTTLVEGVDMTTVNLPFAFDISSGKLVSTSLKFSNWVANAPPFNMECTDINNDGFQDLVIYPGNFSNGKPIIYLNDGTGSFSLVDQTNIPLPPAFYGIATAKYIDIDGDGIRDLLYWPLTVKSLKKGDPVQFAFFKGRRALSLLDIVK